MIDKFAEALQSIDDEGHVEVRYESPFKDIVIDGSYSIEAVEAWLTTEIQKAQEEAWDKAFSHLPTWYDNPYRNS